MIEIEKTFLAKYLPADLKNFPSKEMLDIYVGTEMPHPDLRIRKNGDKYEFTRKSPISESDVSVQKETTIPLSKNEFDDLSFTRGKKIQKTRHLYKLGTGEIAEIDVFSGDLAGLVVVDIEFSSENGKNDFPMPDFCLVEVTQEDFIAGGMLAGKKYADIEYSLNKFGYQKITLA